MTLRTFAVKNGLISLVTLSHLLLAPTLFGQSILDHKIDSLISDMSLREKINQMGNDSKMTTHANDRMGIPGFNMSDGPHGVRYEETTSFPLATSMVAAWDRDLWYEIGKAMGEEFYTVGYDVQLGPSIDLSHNPKNGRSAEAAGEDSYLSGEYASNTIQGIQTNPVMATVKHYSGVNRQAYRMESDIQLTERLMMEQYGVHYRKAVQEGGSLALMTSYNLINGVQTSANSLIVETILKGRWGYPFTVMSDWWAVKSAVDAVNTGTDMCMGGNEYDLELEDLVNNGAVQESTLDASVRRVLKSKMLMGLMDKESPYTVSSRDQSGVSNSKTQDLVREADKKSMILLKNSDNLLPLPTDKKYLVVGPGAETARTNIFGSSWVTTPYTISPLIGIEELVGSENVEHIAGCEFINGGSDQFNDAVALAKDVDYVIFVGGLNWRMEGEGFEEDGEEGNDRDIKTGVDDVQVPAIQSELINKLIEANENTVVYMQSGGVVGVEAFVENVKGLIYSFYPSQEGGHAFAEVLFGGYNPAGRMPVTFPKTDSDMPEWDDDFTNDFTDGYRFYDESGNDFRYAFGYGLSYTTFEYESISISPAAPEVGDIIEVTVAVTNTGDVDGEEVVQLYLSNKAAPGWEPKKELKQFSRIALEKGETKRIVLTLNPEEFYYFDDNSGEYVVAEGDYEIAVGGSSDALPLKESVSIGSGDNKSDLRPLHIYTYPRYAKKGEKVVLVATVKNYGATPTKSDVLVTWSMDGKIVAESESVPKGLLPGQMALVSSIATDVGDGFWEPTGSEKEIVVHVDAGESESELYEDNNERTYTIENPGVYVGVVEEIAVVVESSSEVSSEIESSESSSCDCSSSSVDPGGLPSSDESSPESSSDCDVESSNGIAPFYDHGMLTVDVGVNIQYVAHLGGGASLEAPEGSINYLVYSVTGEVVGSGNLLGSRDVSISEGAPLGMLFVRFF